MSLLLEGWDAYGVIGRMGGRWTMAGTNSLRPALRGTGQAFQCRETSSSVAGGPTRLLQSTAATVVIHADMVREGDAGSAANIVFSFANGAGAEVCKVAVQNTSGDLQVRRGSTLVLTASSAVPTGAAGDSLHFEVEIFASTGSDGYAIVRREGSVIAQIADVRTAQNAGPMARLDLGGTSNTAGAGLTIDNLFVDVTSRGPVLVTAEPFDRDVGTQQWTPDSGGSSTARTSDVPDDGDTSTITSDTVGETNTHGFDGTVLAGRTILAVQRLVCAKLSEAGTDEIAVAFAGQGSPDSLPLSTDYLTRGGAILTQDPDTAAAWTPASLTAQEVTLEHVAG